MNEPLKESSRCQDHSAAQKFLADLCLDASYQSIFDDQRLHATLTQRKARATLQLFFHSLAVKRLIGLRPRCAHGGTLLGIEHAELDTSLVNRSAHFTTKSINLLDEMTLTYAAYRRIARHLTDMIEIQSQHQGPAAHP